MKKYEDNMKKAEFWIKYASCKAVPKEYREDAVHYANILVMRANGFDETK